MNLNEMSSGNLGFGIERQEISKECQAPFLLLLLFSSSKKSWEETEAHLWNIKSMLEGLNSILYRERN